MFYVKSDVKEENRRKYIKNWQFAFGWQPVLVKLLKSNQ